MEKIRFGILGCGTIGDVHAKSIMALEDAELIAICDVNAERAAEYAKRYGVKAYSDYGEMLADPDIVNILNSISHRITVSMT